MKAYLYMRFSSAEQAKGDSLQRQRALANEYLSKRPGVELDEELTFIDEGVSSFTGQNLLPGRELHRFLQCVDDGRIAPGSMLLVESLDRLSRREIIHAQRLLLDILLKGIIVATTSAAESREYSGRSGLQDLIISLAGMERANQESAIKSDRVRRAWKRKKENAAVVKLTRRAPSWLVLSDDRKSFAVVEAKAAVVRTIFALAENIGQQTIARILNEKKIPPFQHGKTGWHSSSVVKILTSPAVIGVYQPHTLVKNEAGTTRVPDGIAIENYYPPIIDAELFYRVQALRGHRRIAEAGRKGGNYTNLFGGIAKCSACGASMVVVDKGKPPKGAKYLVCSSARRSLGCQYRAVPYRHCETGFLMYCQRVDVSEILPSGARNSEAINLRKKHSSMLGEVERKRSLVARMLQTIERNGGDIPKAIQQQLVDHERAIDNLTSDISEAGKKLKLLENDARQFVGMRTMFIDLFVSLLKATPTERYILRSKLHGVLKAAISKIEIGEAEARDKKQILKLVKRDQEKFLENRGKPGYPHLPTQYATDGKVTCFRVLYKNGNSYDLFIDSKSVVAGRLTYSAEAASDAKAKGQDTRAPEMHLAIYDDGPQEPPPRGRDGKFSKVSKPVAVTT